MVIKVKVENYSYETFPEFDEYVEGMLEVEGDTNNLRVRMLDVTYQDDCIIRFVYPNDYFDESLKFPLIIHVQGSGWYKQDMADHIFDYMPIVKKGYAFAIVQYHEAPKYRYPTQINDVKNAIRYLQEHYNEYPIDMNHVFLSGDSSGAHVALMTLFTYDEDLVKLDGMIDFYGITDFLTFYEEGYSKYDETDFRNIYDFMGGDKYELPELYKEASPLYYVKEGMNLPPMLIMHGSKDHVVPFIQSVKLYKKLKEYGYDVTFYKVNGADHGKNYFYVEPIYNAIVDFLEKCKVRNDI